MKIEAYEAQPVAEFLLPSLLQGVRERGHCLLGIPGGRSPNAVLCQLAGLIPENIRRCLHLVWLDERAVPQGHADRNDASTLAAWRQGGADPAHIHPMMAHDQHDLSIQAEAYHHLLKPLLTAEGGLDAALVGMGEDGHMASLFPGHPLLQRKDSLTLIIEDSPKPPARRLTLSLPVIARSSVIAVLAIGEAKREALIQAKLGPTPKVPVSLLPDSRTVFYTDLKL